MDISLYIEDGKYLVVKLKDAHGMTVSMDYISIGQLKQALAANPEGEP